LGKYRKAWENIVELGKMSKSVGKCRKAKESITEGTGKIVKKNIAKVAIFPKNGELSMGKLLSINDNVRKLA
jgi:hypothetical protein